MQAIRLRSSPEWLCGRIDRRPITVEFGNADQVVRYAPETVTLARAFCDLLFERLIQFAQRLFGAPALGDVDVCAHKAQSAFRRASRSISAFTRIQRTCPSLGRMMRYSERYSRTSPLIASKKCLHRASRDLPDGRGATQSSCVSVVVSRRQAVDAQIFGRTAGAKSAREIDLDTANLTDLLHACEFASAGPAGHAQPRRASSSRPPS